MSDDSHPTNWLAALPDSNLTPVAPPTPPANDPPPTPTSTFSLWALFALIGGLVTVVFACVSSLALAATANLNPSIPTLMSFVLAVAIPGVPLAWYAWRRLQGQTSKPWQTQLWWIVVGVIALILVITLGQLLISVDLVPNVIASLVQPLVFYLATIVVLTLAAGGWTGLNPLRVWSHFVSGAWVAVVLSIAAEFMIIGGLALVVLIIWAAVAPEQLQELAQLFRLQPEQIDPEVIFDLVRQPWVIGLAYLVAAVIIPLIEELAKSVGVIAIVGQRPAPMNAFLGGLLGGLGFAFTESLSNLINLQDPWFVLVVARLGTLSMHGFASSLVGWGWGQLSVGRPDRLALAYLGAVGVHGLWNAAVVTFVYATLSLTENPTGDSPLAILLGLLIGLCVIVLVLLVPICLGGLMWFGYRLRNQAATT